MGKMEQPEGEAEQNTYGRLKERKKESRQSKGGMGGRHTPPPHRDFKERSVMLAVAHPCGRLPEGPRTGGPGRRHARAISVPQHAKFSLSARLRDYRPAPRPG